MAAPLLRRSRDSLDVDRRSRCRRWLSAVPLAAAVAGHRLPARAGAVIERGSNLEWARDRRAAHAGSVRAASGDRRRGHNDAERRHDTRRGHTDYVLKEAERQENGERLGQVSGRIVGEVLVGLLEKDSRSYLRRDPRFRPQPPFVSAPGHFVIGDLLKFAGAA